MKVLKEAFIIEDTGGMYMCAQNTQTPKLYASKASAQSAVDYYIGKDSLCNVHVGYKIKQVFLVLGDDDGN
jgi:hypothetical protein